MPLETLGANRYGPVPTNKYDSNATTLSVGETWGVLMEGHVIPDYGKESERSKIVSWLIIASSWICALLIFFVGFFLADFLEMFGLSEDVSFEFMGILVYIAVLAMTMGYISWDGDLSRTLQMFKIGSFRIGFIFLIGLPIAITVIDIVVTNIYDMLYIMLLGDPYIRRYSTMWMIQNMTSFLRCHSSRRLLQPQSSKRFCSEVMSWMPSGDSRDAVAVLGSAGCSAFCTSNPMW
ncbi:MAG: hypothetical protein CM1200mP32_05390 [Methanobacteriota archaeon]|nr:MAG: hypothetical protein CM1200mP32_05390 [Euryarchaeota archaeon]